MNLPKDFNLAQTTLTKPEVILTYMRMAQPSINKNWMLFMPTLT